MDGFEVIDNFLEQESFNELQKFFMSPRSQWRFVDFVVSKDQDNQKKDGYFVHSFRDLHPVTFEDRFPISPNYDVLYKLLDKLKKKVNFNQILRIRSSLFPRREKQNSDAFHVDYKFDHSDEDLNCDSDREEKENSKSLFLIFLAGMGGGLIALLTPCVFPMIPITVGFFTKKSPTKAKGIKNAIIYGLSIIVIYVFLGLAFTMAFGADTLNLMSTNVYFNLFFATSTSGRSNPL